MSSLIELTRGDVLREGVRLRARARSQIVDVNAAYFLVHNVMSNVLRAGAKPTSAANLEDALRSEVEEYFDPAPLGGL